MPRFLLLAPFLLTLPACTPTAHVTRPRCEYLDAPCAIPTPNPRLSWQMTSSRPADHQTAYQIRVGTTPNAADLWDAGRVPSEDSLNIPYAGRPLPTSTPLYYTIRLWNADDRPSDWSPPTTFRLAPKDLSPAQWIRPAHPTDNLLRKSFTLPAKVKRATLHICGLGYYETHLNGQKIGDQVLSPPQTDYEQRALYDTYDVTPLLSPGRNTLGIILGTGWFDQHVVWGGMSYGPPCAIALLHLELANGQTETVGTDNTWLSAPGPITQNNIYAGESYNARREVPDWDRTPSPTPSPRYSGERVGVRGSAPRRSEAAGSPPINWSPVTVIPSPTQHLEPALIPPNKIDRLITPVAVSHPKPDVTIYDLGENIAGWARIRTSAPAGATTKLRFAEALSKDGTLDTASTGVFATHVEQADTYTSDGSPAQTWEPRFTYHGFRYVESTGAPLTSLTGVVVHSAVTPTGSFECSDPTLNTIHAMALRTELSNLHGVPSDCPARERCGWLGDAHATAELTCLNFDMSTFWPKYLDDIETSRHGQLPGDVAPGKRGTSPNGHPDWGMALILLPWFQYQYYGDTQTLDRHYPAMRQFLLTTASHAQDGIVNAGYGDWCPPGSVEPTQTPPALTTTALLYRTATLMTTIAHVTNHDTDATEYNHLAAATKNAFNQHFLKLPIAPPTQRDAGVPPAQFPSYGSQTANAIALAYHLCPPDLEQPIADALNADVLAHHTHPTTGIFGSRYLYDALASHHHPDTAFALLHQTTYPSIGDLISKGATTFWECWGEPELDAKWGARSLNHPMQAGFDAWFYQGILGLRPDPTSPALKHLTLRPQLTHQLSWARGHITTPYGPLSSSWQSTPHSFTWTLTLPPNTTATAYLPDDPKPHELPSGTHTLTSRHD